MPWPRWEDNIRINLKEIGINMRNWVDSVQDMDYWRALVSAALNVPKHLRADNNRMEGLLGNPCEPVSFQAMAKVLFILLYCHNNNNNNNNNNNL